MAKISPKLYILIGILIAAASVLIEWKRLMIFAIAGFVMIIIGVWNLPKSAKTKPAKVRPRMQRPGIKYCRYCGNAMRITDKSCPRCGRPA